MRSSRLLGGVLICGLRSRSCKVISIRAMGRTVRILGDRPFSLMLLSVGLPSKSKCTVTGAVQGGCDSAVMVFLATGSERDSRVQKCRLKTMSCVAGPFSVCSLREGIRGMLHVVKRRISVRSIFSSNELFLGFTRRATVLNKGPLALSALRFQVLGLFYRGHGHMLAEGRLLRGV